MGCPTLFYHDLTTQIDETHGSSLHESSIMTSEMYFMLKDFGIYLFGTFGIASGPLLLFSID